MGICSGKQSSANDSAVKGAGMVSRFLFSHFQANDDNREVKSMQDMKISQSDFIFENKGRFRDHYSIGISLGTGKRQTSLNPVGAFGDVRKCVNKKTGTTRAVKIIRKDALDGKEKIRFFYEIEILRQLDHPNIIRLYEIFQDEKRYYLVTE